MSYFFNIITYEQIKSLWENRIRESTNLEFKAEIDPNNNEISKDISSFANGEGGVIIYGLKEDSKTGIALQSEGIELNKENERIEQIVSSTISPWLQIKIDVIYSVESQANKGFLVVKIPKSELYIHQTTSGKFYVRNNTTTNQYKFEPAVLRESDIALRYEKRFVNKKRIESILENRTNQLLKNDDSQQRYLLLASVPQTIPSLNLKITKESFNLLITSKENGDSISSNDFLYSFISSSSFFFDNRPNGKGRTVTTERGELLEINNDGSVFLFIPVPSNGQWDWWNHLFVIVDFLHLIRRFYGRINYFGGITMRCVIGNNFPIDRRGNHIQHLDFDTIMLTAGGGPVDWKYKSIIIDENIQITPFELKQSLLSIFDSVFENVGIDNPREIFPSLVKKLENKVDLLEKQFEQRQMRDQLISDIEKEVS